LTSIALSQLTVFVSAPLQKELDSDDIKFKYINGPVRIIPPQGKFLPQFCGVPISSYPGFDEYFGVGPHYRWADDGGAAEDSMITRVRQIPVGDNAEDVMRDLVGDREVVWLNYKQVMDYLYEQLEKDPKIGGIIGYSEGAAMASTFILDEQRREKDEGRARRIKCAMFVTGWPPMTPDRGLILADEQEDVIDVPSLHVVGANGRL
jgi:predicted esterase